MMSALTNSVGLHRTNGWVDLTTQHQLISDQGHGGCWATVAVDPGVSQLLEGKRGIPRLNLTRRIMEPKRLRPGASWARLRASFSKIYGVGSDSVAPLSSVSTAPIQHGPRLGSAAGGGGEPARVGLSEFGPLRTSMDLFHEEIGELLCHAARPQFGVPMGFQK